MYRSEDGRTVGHDRHHGPLRVLRSLYPEGPGICHHVLVHPPGGIVGGDTLDIRVSVGQGAHALITTPGATRFYRSAGPEAAQDSVAAVGEGARLEWLPLETIAYPGTRALNRMRFDLAPSGEMIGWDLLSLGLPASGAPFDRGRFEQSIALPGAWLERAVIDAADDRCRRLMTSPLGFDGRTALATLWCARGSAWPAATREALLETARQVLSEGEDPSRGGVTSPDPRFVVVRALACRIEPLWGTLRAIRHAWRALAWNLPVDSPRVWST